MHRWAPRSYPPAARQVVWRRLEEGKNVYTNDVIDALHLADSEGYQVSEQSATAAAIFLKKRWLPRHTGIRDLTAVHTALLGLSVHTTLFTSALLSDQPQLADCSDEALLRICCAAAGHTTTASSSKTALPAAILTRAAAAELISRNTPDFGSVSSAVHFLLCVKEMQAAMAADPIASQRICMPRPLVRLAHAYVQAQARKGLPLHTDPFALHAIHDYIEQCSAVSGYATPALQGGLTLHQDIPVTKEAMSSLLASVSSHTALTAALRWVSEGRTAPITSHRLKAAVQYLRAAGSDFLHAADALLCCGGREAVSGILSQPPFLGYIALQASQPGHGSFVKALGWDTGKPPFHALDANTLPFLLCEVLRHAATQKELPTLDAVVRLVSAEHGVAVQHCPQGPAFASLFAARLGEVLCDGAGRLQEGVVTPEVAVRILPLRRYLVGGRPGLAQQVLRRAAQGERLSEAHVLSVLCAMGAMGVRSQQVLDSLVVPRLLEYRPELHSAQQSVELLAASLDVGLPRSFMEGVVQHLKAPSVSALMSPQLLERFLGALQRRAELRR